MYTCPMHPEIKRSSPGKCPKCGMDLVKETDTSGKKSSKLLDYLPLIIVIALITVSAFLISAFNFTITNLMRSFMAGFFVVFAGFKLMDLKGFKDAYSTYDILAQRLPVYGYIYPFLELALGFSYMINVFPVFTNVFAFILMSFSGLGVAISLAQKKKFRCACLGTFLKVPLTSITLMEDFGMALMALLALML